MQKNGKAQVATIIYSMGVYFKHLPQEKEEQRMEDSKLLPGVRRILRNQIFKKMLETEGLDKLAEHAIKGGGRLTNAYLNAAEALKPKAERVKPEQMTQDDKVKFWENSTLGLQ